jgi:hypothetical protein
MRCKIDERRMRKGKKTNVHNCLQVSLSLYVKKTIENCDKKRWLCMAGSEHGEHFYWLRFKKDLSLNTAVYATL